jgi:hypothetical protein
MIYLVDCCGDVVVGEFSIKVKLKLESPLVGVDEPDRTGLNPKAVDLVLVEDVQHLHQGSLGVIQSDA